MHAVAELTGAERALADAGFSPRLNSPKVLEARRRQLSVANRMLDVAVTEVSLQRPRVMSSVGQSVAAGVLEASS
jgi:hypothetical protein